MSKTPVTVRFAPSPTGLIHIGNARTALFNWLFALKAGGRFVLRLDDTDEARSRAEFAEAIEADLHWLGIRPDLVVRQSDRADRHRAAAEALRRSGRLYACYETPDELERRRKRRLAQGRPPVYDRAGLRLSDDEKRTLEAEGRRPHWRFLLSNSAADGTVGHRDVVWDDLVRGRQSIDLGSLSDPVLVREDGTFLYTLPSVVDDIDLGISHVIRGDDHVANTAVQIDLFEALGATAPVFGHHNLLTTASGEGLSKRLGALSIGSLRDAGYEPMAVASLAVLIGTSDAVEPARDLGALAEHFDLGHVSHSASRFDPDDIGNLNARLLHAMPYAEVRVRLAELGVAGGELFWDVVKGNLARLAEAGAWWRIVEGPLEPVTAEEDRAFLTTAEDLLPPEPWDETTWGNWTGALKAATGRKG
ncbi:MAG: glutamate--tRNA ligase, partial [Microbacterium sp.]